MEGPKKNTLSPSVTGTSILGVKFDGGVVIAADMLGSYGSMAKLFDLPRLFKVNDLSILAGSGDYADLQYLNELVEQRVNQDFCLNDGYVYQPKALFSWCTRVLYNRRSKMNPLWNRLVVGGLQQGEPFLGCVDMIGNAYESDVIATGYGNYLAIPIMRETLERNNNKLTQEQACDLIDRCMKLLFYRDARAYDKYSIGVITREGVKIEEFKKLQTNWDIAHFVRGYD